jgi:hypothetical protein
MGNTYRWRRILNHPLGCVLMQTNPAHRMKDEVVAALAKVTGVRRIASFGSVAAGRADPWSDVDLFVACADVDRTAWFAAAAIRAAKPIFFYRMFTGVPQPSGRYWFADESPFTRLDVSFYAPADFEAVCRDGLTVDHPVTVRIEHVCDPAPVALLPDPASHTAAPVLDITPAETEAGRLLYVHLEAVKAERRGHVGKRDSRQTREALRHCLATPLEMAGGDFERLARQCLEL